MKQNILKTRLNVPSIKEALYNEEAIGLIVPERKMGSTIKKITSFDLSLEATNAQTRCLIENSVVGFGLGAGIGAGASALGLIPGPLSLIALASGAAGAAAAFFCTKYKIRITHIGESGGENIYSISMTPAS